MKCSVCREELDSKYLCFSETCGYRPGGMESKKAIEGRYRRPLTADGTRSLSNQGFVQHAETAEQAKERFARNLRAAAERALRAAQRDPRFK